MFTSLKNLAATLVAVLHTRLAIFCSDLEEGRERLLSLLVMAFISLFCLCVGVLLLTLLIVVAFWDTHRLLALSSLTAVFLIAGTVLCVFALRALRTMPRIFSASLAELANDYEALNDKP